MAAILAKAIAVQIKRGLGKEYIPQTEPLSALRGKYRYSRVHQDTNHAKETDDLYL